MRLRSFRFLYSILVVASLLPVLLSCGGGKPKTVHNTPDPVIESFRVEPATITEGDEATLVPTFREGVGRITAQGQPVMNGNSETIGSGARVKVFPKETTTYTLTVTNGNPAADKRQEVTITVLPKPQKPVLGIKSYVTLGKPVQVSVQEQPGCTYQWSVSQNGFVDGEINKPQVTLMSTALGAMPVKCVVTNGAGGSDEASGIVTVFERPMMPIVSVSTPTTPMAYFQEGKATVPEPQKDCVHVWDIAGGSFVGAVGNHAVRFKPDPDTRLCILKCWAQHNLTKDLSEVCETPIDIDPEGPVVQSFKSGALHFDPRKGTTLTAVFTGKGVVNPGNLPIESGKPLTVKPFHPMLYELIVTKNGKEESQRLAVYPAQTLSAGQEHTVARLADGTVRAWGRDLFGQLGHNRVLENTLTDENKTCCIPAQEVVDSAKTAIQKTTLVAAGSKHCLALTQRGPMAWGCNYVGQLGSGDNAHRSHAAFMKSTEPFKQARMIAAGYAFNLVLDEGGLWGCGNNRCGQLGPDTTKAVWNGFERMSFKAFDTKEVEAVSAGGSHSLFLTKAGTVHFVGRYVDTTDAEMPISEEKVLPGLDSPEPKQVANLDRVVAIASGYMHSVALKSDGTVWAWGNNSHGSLGNETLYHATEPVMVSGLDHVVAIAAGYWHSFAIKSDGTVWGWGRNDLAQIDGENKNASITKPVPFTAFKDVVDAVDVVAIAAGEAHSVALVGDGRVFSWGNNEFGQTGNWQWPTVEQLLPIKSGQAIYGEAMVKVENLHQGSASIGIRFDSSERIGIGWGGALGDGTPYSTSSGEPAKVAIKGVCPDGSDPSAPKFVLFYFSMPGNGGAKATITNIRFKDVSDPNNPKDLWDKGDIAIEIKKAQKTPLRALVWVNDHWDDLAL